MTAANSTVYDAILTNLAALFPNKQRITNPYTIEDNPDFQLRDGYGLKIGSSSVGSVNALRKINEQTSFGVVLSKEFIGLDVESDYVDAEIKQMIEDKLLIVREFLSSDELTSDDQINLITYEGSDPIENVITESTRLITMEISFSIDINEDI